jgi:NTE family protein
MNLRSAQLVRMNQRTKVVKKLKIGLALSGGGSRAIAFHLGCMRALHDKGILDRVNLISSVSGGSVIAALYAYFDEPFDQFEKRTETLLRKGLLVGIAQKTLFSSEMPKIAGTILTSGILALVGKLLSMFIGILGMVGIKGAFTKKIALAAQAPLPRYASRTTAFAKYLDNAIFHEKLIPEIERRNLELVINATELRTGSAFRYGTKECGSWRFGKLVEPVSVAKAVAASAAFPAFLPAFDEFHLFSKQGKITSHRTIITDGGVYDNLGISCLIPGRDAKFSTNVSDVDFIICSVAGQGLPDSSQISYHWGSRMSATVSAIHRRTHSMSFDLLHRLARSGEINGFILPYLGQQDESLPCPPPDLVPRSETFDYPTDFNSMSEKDIERISLRGEQLTRNLLETYHPGL